MDSTLEVRLATLETSVATLQTTSDMRQENVERFWSQTWPKMEATLEALTSTVTSIREEQLTAKHNREEGRRERKEFRQTLTSLQVDVVGLKDKVVTKTDFEALKEDNKSTFITLRGELGELGTLYAKMQGVMVTKQDFTTFKTESNLSTNSRISELQEELEEDIESVKETVAADVKKLAEDVKDVSELQKKHDNLLTTWKAKGGILGVIVVGIVSFGFSLMGEKIKKLLGL